MSHRLPGPFGSLLLAVSLVAAAPLAAQGGPDCPPNSVAVTVTFDGGAGTVAVDKPSVEIVRPGHGEGATSVCWKVQGLGEGQTLHIEGKDGDDSYFPSLDRTVTPPRTAARSGAPAKVGTWRYGLRVTDGSGGTLAHLDPEVIIRG